MPGPIKQNIKTSRRPGAARALRASAQKRQSTGVGNYAPAQGTRTGGSSGGPFGIDLKFDPFSIGNALRQATGKRRR